MQNAMSSVAMTKRKRSDSQANHQAKRKKVKCTSTSIVNLNDDCLEEIFLYLSQKDLVSVSAANTRFKYASENVFTRKYGKLQIVVSMIQDNQENPSGIKGSLQLIRAFGHLITKLFIEFELELVADLCKTISNNCGKNIIELEFRHSSRGNLDPIFNDKELEKMDSFLDGLNEQFPNLRHLKIECDKSSNKKCQNFKSLVQHFPNLLSMTLSGSWFSINDIMAFVSSNRQLECLALIGTFIALHRLKLSRTFLNYLDSALTTLKMLELTDVDGPQKYVNQFENLKMLTIGNFQRFLRYEDRSGYFSVGGQNIEQISVYFDLVSDLPSFANAISRFKKVKRLVFQILFNNIWSMMTLPRLRECSEIISANTSLTEVDIQLYRKKPYTVGYAGTTFLNIIKSAFGTGQWSLSEEGNRLIFTKVHQNYN